MNAPAFSLFNGSKTNTIVQQQNDLHDYLTPVMLDTISIHLTFVMPFICMSLGTTFAQSLIGTIAPDKHLVPIVYQSDVTVYYHLHDLNPDTSKRPIIYKR